MDKFRLITTESLPLIYVQNCVFFSISFEQMDGFRLSFVFWHTLIRSRLE